MSIGLQGSWLQTPEPYYLNPYKNLTQNNYKQYEHWCQNQRESTSYNYASSHIKAHHTWYHLITPNTKIAFGFEYIQLRDLNNNY
jgi:hypothetical protein